MNEPTVAVIIPTHNRSGYLAQTLKSVFDQTRPPDELIVVDDGSTDDTAELCGRYLNVRYIYQGNQGRSKACNVALQSTRCCYVSFVDDDDLLEEHAIELQLIALSANAECSVVYGRTVRIDRDGAIVGEDLVGHRIPVDLVSALFYENFVRIQTVLVRRDDVVAAGGFDACLWPCDDYDLWLRLAISGKRFAYIPEALARYRVHAGSVSSQGERMARAALAVALKNAEGHAPGVTSNAHYRLGRTLLENGVFAEARHELEIAVSGKPSSLQYRLYALLAAHPQLMGRSFRAVQLTKRLVVQGMTRAGLLEKRWGG